MNLQWYIRRDETDVEKGPFERAGLVEAVMRGETSREVQVRREDQVDWSTLGEHSAFRAGLTGWRPGAPEDGPIADVGAIPGLTQWRHLFANLLRVALFVLIMSAVVGLMLIPLFMLISNYHGRKKGKIIGVWCSFSLVVGYFVARFVGKRLGLKSDWD